jgi:hypothetical protein
MSFDFIDHHFLIEDSNGFRSSLKLAPMTVADFCHWAEEKINAAGHDLRIHGAPNEIEPPTPFALDHEVRAYDPDSAARAFRALLSADRVLRRFRSGFLGKVSPVHFFWGSFDLAVTRFSSREAPLHPGGIPHLPDVITREAYSHEVSSTGFWPGGASGGAPFFYSYAYPSPEGFLEAQVSPEAARFDTTLGEFVLDYEAVRASRDPEGTLLSFLQSTYSVAADLGRWDRQALECELGRPGVPRALSRNPDQPPRNG